MNAHQNASRITDVVPANFLCDNQTMQKISESQLSDEKALSLVDDNLLVLESRQLSLKDELAAVEKLISEALAEQTRLRSSIETHKSLLSHSPVRSLPGEVLSEIFLHYIAVSRPTRGTAFREIVASHRSRARILQICRRWRTTALGDPRLWTTISLIGSGESWDEARKYKEGERFAHPMLSGSPQERDSYWKALESQIKRTSSLPLQLLFHYDERGNIGNYDDTISSLKTFIRLLPRANSIFLSIHSSNGSFPQLRSLMSDAKIPRADQVHTARIKVNNRELKQKLLSATQNVEVLEVESRAIKHWLADVPTAGHRLRCLHISQNSSSISLAELLDILERAPLLETVKVAQISISPPSIGTLRVVTHPHLSAFYLSSLTEDENDAIFEHLTLPALRSLSFGPTFPYAWPRPSNMAFFERSGCMLTSLSFHECLVDEQRLVALLTAQNKLTTLQLNFFANGKGEGAAIPKAILDFLSVKPNGTADPPLPLLTILKLSVLPRQLKAVKRLIESRFELGQATKSGVASLKEAGIDVQMKQVKEKIKKDQHTALFKALTKEGMTIRISYRHVS